MADAYIGIGSNLGDRKRYIDTAIDMLKRTPNIEVKKVSPLYETDPVGGPPQGRFLNGVIKIETDFTPEELLEKLHEIEERFGRIREVRNGPRTMDLDILTYGNVKIDRRDLTIPHPRMDERDFVKRPLRDLLSSDD